MRMLRWMCEVTRKEKIRNDRTHPRNNKSGAGFQKDHRENIELVRAFDEERCQTHTEESVEGGYTREKEERTTENKMERSVSTRFEKYWTSSSSRVCHHTSVTRLGHSSRAMSASYHPAQ